MDLDRSDFKPVFLTVLQSESSAEGEEGLCIPKGEYGEQKNAEEKDQLNSKHKAFRWPGGREKQVGDSMDLERCID